MNENNVFKFYNKLILNKVYCLFHIVLIFIIFSNFITNIKTENYLEAKFNKYLKNNTLISEKDKQKDIDTRIKLIEDLKLIDKTSNHNLYDSKLNQLIYNFNHISDDDKHSVSILIHFLIKQWQHSHRQL